MTRHHRRAHLPADRLEYVPVPTEVYEALRAVARAGTSIVAAHADLAAAELLDALHDARGALDALPHLLDDVAAADSHAERAAEEHGVPVVVDVGRVLTGAPFGTDRIYATKEAALAARDEEVRRG